MFVTHYASNKPIKKEAHYIFSIIQGSKETTESYIKIFKVKKLEILGCPSFVAIKVVGKGVNKNSKLFVELTKIIPKYLETMYLEAQKFVNMKR